MTDEVMPDRKSTFTTVAEEQHRSEVPIDAAADDDLIAVLHVDRRLDCNAFAVLRTGFRRDRRGNPFESSPHPVRVADAQAYAADGSMGSASNPGDARPAS